MFQVVFCGGKVFKIRFETVEGVAVFVVDFLSCSRSRDFYMKPYRSGFTIANDAAGWVYFAV